MLAYGAPCCHAGGMSYPVTNHPGPAGALASLTLAVARAYFHGADDDQVRDAIAAGAEQAAGNPIIAGAIRAAGRELPDGETLLGGIAA